MKNLRFLLLALLVPVFGYSEDWIPQAIGPFGTLNDRDNSYAIPADKSQSLLNVDITEGGKSVKKREGYGLAYTLTVTTSPVHGIYNFFDSNGNDVSLFAHDTRLSASVSGASATVLFSTGPNGATYQCTDSLGFAYCANSMRTTIIKTNGATYSLLNTVTSTGTMIAAGPTRLGMAGFSEAPSRIDFSASADFTDWTTGSLGTSGFRVTINAPGARITHLTYAFGRWMWFKDTSFGFIIEGNQPFQTDWVNKTVSYDVGTNDNTSVYREGILYFRGKDAHIYAFDGSNYWRLSKEIAGTINQSQSRASNSWTQTSQSDFQAGGSAPGGWVSTTVAAGSVVLDTAAAVAPFVDTSSANFAAGALVNLDSTTIDGSLLLTIGATIQRETPYGSDDEPTNTCGNVTTPYVVFLTTTSYILTNATFRLKKINSPPSTITYTVKSNSSGAPGTTLVTGTGDVSSVGTSYSDINIDLTDIPLTNGTSYWIGLNQTTNGCDNVAPNVMHWATDTSYPTGATYTNARNEQFTYNTRLIGKSFSTSGSIVSRSFDVGFTTATWLWAWSSFTVTSVTPSNTTLTYETQTSSSSTGQWTTLASVSSGSAPTSLVQEFIRYKASFATTNTSTSPALSDVTINMTSRLRPDATYFSSVKNAPSLTTWDTFQVTKQDNGGSHSFFMRSSTNAINVMSSTPSWTSVTAGGIPTLSTGTYFQVADRISVSSYGALTLLVGPKLDDLTQNWFEGSASDKAYATYFDNKIWWSVASGAGATSNNKILLYDLLNQGWTIYDLASNGFLTRQNHLYFGSATGGYVYKYGDTDSDNGTAINSYWKSKDFFGASPFATQEIANISIAAGSVANSSMTVTYTLNGQNDTSYTMDLYNSTGAFKIKNKNLPSGTVANTFAIKFGNSVADQPWEVFAVQLGIRPRSWTSGP